MAQRWSVKEDYIVCKYTYEKKAMALYEEGYAELSLILKENGFPARSQVAITKRVREYICLFLGEQSPYLNEQISSVFSTFMERLQNRDMQGRIKSYIKETYNPAAANDEVIDSSLASSFNLNGALATENYIHTLDFNETFPMVLQKFLDKKGFKKYTEVYRPIEMKQDTFSSILRGKYDYVDKKNVLKLCIGLKLNLEEAEELMASAGYTFSPAIMVDVVIKACIVNRCYSPVLVDIELYDNGIKKTFFC